MVLDVSRTVSPVLLEDFTAAELLAPEVIVLTFGLSSLLVDDIEDACELGMTDNWRCVIGMSVDRLPHNLYCANIQGNVTGSFLS
jgi:hypothetical protein